MEKGTQDMADDNAFAAAQLAAALIQAGKLTEKARGNTVEVETVTEIIPPPPLYPLPGPETSPPPCPAVRKLESPALSARADSMVLDLSADPARPEGRDAKGRFASGNSGRPKGARSRLITDLS
jgi:hypothetical protein